MEEILSIASKLGLLCFAIIYAINLSGRKEKLNRESKTYSSISYFEEDRFCLFLRSFSRDDNKMKPSSDFLNLFVSKSNQETVDLYVYTLLKDQIPIIKITNPNGKKQEKGLSEVKLDDNWMENVMMLVEKSKLIIISGTVSDGLIWELDQIFSKGYLCKTVFVASSSYQNEQENKKLFELLQSSYGVSVSHDRKVPLFVIENMRTQAVPDLFLQSLNHFTE